MGGRLTQPRSAGIQCIESPQLQSAERQFDHGANLWHYYRDGQSNGYLQWCWRRRFAAHFAGSDEARLLGALQPAFSICGNEGPLKLAFVTTIVFASATSGS